MQLDFALRAARIHRAAHGVQIGKSEYPPAVVTQANAGVVQIGARHVYPHVDAGRSEVHTSELQSLMRTSYAVSCLKKKILNYTRYQQHRPDTKITSIN